MTSIVILSGGMDSATLLYDICRDNNVITLTFDYGQRHRKEIVCARQLADKLGVSNHLLVIPVLNGSALTHEGDVPEGHYTHESMKRTVVPNRNMVMLSHAVSFAIAEGCDKVYYGAHAGDHAIYPDCRREFIHAFNIAVQEGNYSAPIVEAPYLYLTKGEILTAGLELSVDYSLTWTCYNGREKACGKCGSCVERLEAFADNDANDPVEYEL